MGFGIGKIVRGIVRNMTGKQKLQKLEHVELKLNGIKPKESKMCEQLNTDLLKLKKPMPCDAFSKESLKKAAAPDGPKINVDIYDIFGPLK